jgi:hypothetical protein
LREAMNSIFASNEHRTSNIERPTSNEKQTSIKYSMLDVRCSMFNLSVALQQSIQRKNNLPPVGWGG